MVRTIATLSDIAIALGVILLCLWFLRQIHTPNRINRIVLEDRIVLEAARRRQALADLQTQMEKHQTVEDLEIQARAESLVRQVLGPEEFALLSIRGFVDVPSKEFGRQKWYRVRRNQDGVLLYENGIVRASICIFCDPDAFLPQDDRFLALYLVTKYDEGRILSTGGVTWH